MKIKNLVEKEVLEKALKSYENHSFSKYELDRLKAQLKGYLKSVVILEKSIQEEKDKLMANAAIAEAIRELLDLPIPEKEPEQLEFEFMNEGK